MFNTIVFILRFYLNLLQIKVLTLYFHVVGHAKKTKFDILYLEVFPEDGAGFNYRAKKWMELLEHTGATVDARFLVRQSADFFQQTKDSNLQKFLLDSMRIRKRQIIESRQYRIVIVRRSLLLYNNYGNLFFEKLLKAAHPNRLLDIDDDTLVVEAKKNVFSRIMCERHDHFYRSFQYYNGFITGSNYLKELVLEKRDQQETCILVVPTCVDYDKYPTKVYSETSPLVFGWIGGNHNLYQLKSIIPALNTLYETQNFELRVIAGVTSYDFNAKFPVHFIPFDLNTEVEELKKIDIGLMPLEDSITTRGKCGFKLIQYMGLGIPGIASAITVNTEIITDGENGWLVNTPEEWLDKLKTICDERSRLGQIGLKARATIEDRYSFKAHFEAYRTFLHEFSDKCHS